MDVCDASINCLCAGVSRGATGLTCRQTYTRVTQGVDRPWIVHVLPHAFKRCCCRHENAGADRGAAQGAESAGACQGGLVRRHPAGCGCVGEALLLLSWHHVGRVGSVAPLLSSAASCGIGVWSSLFVCSCCACSLMNAPFLFAASVATPAAITTTTPADPVSRPRVL